MEISRKSKPSVLAASSRCRQDISGGSAFGDVASGTYYTDAVSWAVSNGITNGNGPNSFGPAADCSRGQIVTFLFRHMAE